MTVNHTPLPWATSAIRPYYVIRDGLDVAMCHHDADAAYIVQACNAHPVLVEALRKIESANNGGCYSTIAADALREAGVK